MIAAHDEASGASFARTLYSIGWCLATPLVIVYLLWRSRRQPAYRRHWPERWGLQRRRRDDAPLVWVHAVSVGETRAAQPLVAALLARDPRCRVLLTHMTPTGREAGAELLVARHGDRVVQAYLPYDYPFAPRRFLAAWRPRAGILMETELWPNLCAAAARAGVPLALVNARLSEKSLRKGLRWSRVLAPALRSLSLVVAQTPADARRIRSLAPVDVTVAGNMKFDVAPAPAQVERGRAWRARVGARAVLLAASTRDGEEALLLDAWTALRARSPEPPLLVIVPRHPQRFEEVAILVQRRGLRLGRRTGFDATAPAGAHDPGGADVLLGDSMGEMFAYYAMADVAIIGGSLLPFGGQNLIEACAAGVPVVLGQHTYNFADAAEQAIGAGAARRVPDAAGALSAALELLADAPGRRQAAERAARFAAEHRGATQRTMRAIEPLLVG